MRNGPELPSIVMALLASLAPFTLSRTVRRRFTTRPTEGSLSPLAWLVPSRMDARRGNNRVMVAAGS